MEPLMFDAAAPPPPLCIWLVRGRISSHRSRSEQGLVSRRIAAAAAAAALSDPLTPWFLHLAVVGAGPVCAV